MTSYEVRALLSPQDSLRALHEALVKGAVADNMRLAMAGLSPALLPQMVTELKATADRLLRVDLLTVLGEGWQQYGKLREAAHSSLAEPDSPMFVAARRHAITWETSPQIQLLVDSQVRWTVTLTIRCGLDVSALVAKIENGAITAFLAGRCRGTVAFAVNSHQVFDEFLERNLSREVTLRQPISLLSDRARGTARPGGSRSAEER